MKFLVRVAATALLVGGLSAAGAAPASALTLGTTATSVGPRAFTCPLAGVYVQAGSGGSFTSRVPSDQAGTVTSWSYNATSTTAGTKIGLVVTKPTDTGFTVTGVDLETVPVQASPGVVTFPLATPLPIERGGAIGLYSESTTAICGSAEPPASPNVGAFAQLSSPPGVGYQIPNAGGPGTVNVSAEIDTAQDLTLTSLATASTIANGATSSVIFTATSRSAAAGATHFVATIPVGLHLVTAVAGATPCAVLGTSVSCELAAAGSVPPTVVLIVAGDAPGAYQVTGTINGVNPDKAPDDNTASSAVTVLAPPVQPKAVVGPPTFLPPACVTVSVAGLTTKVASRLLTALHCKPVVGKAKSSKTVKKGLVITTDPGPSKTLAGGATVQIIPSSGKPKAKAKKKGSK